MVQSLTALESRADYSSAILIRNIAKLNYQLLAVVLCLKNSLIKLYTHYAVPSLALEQKYRVTEEWGLVLECHTRGLPATATLWSRDGALITSDDTDATALSDYRASHYLTTLTLSGRGLFSCDIYSDWVTTDKRNSGRQSELSYT